MVDVMKNRSFFPLSRDASLEDLVPRVHLYHRLRLLGLSLVRARYARSTPPATGRR